MFQNLKLKNSLFSNTDAKFLNSVDHVMYFHITVEVFSCLEDLWDKYNMLHHMKITFFSDSPYL
jgi:hypothetical protein